MAVPKASWGHRLEVSLVVGGKTGSLLLDDVVVRQRCSAKEPAAKAAVHADFEDCTTEVAALDLGGGSLQAALSPEPLPSQSMTKLAPSPLPYPI